jgi:hypothetical protein
MFQSIQRIAMYSHIVLMLHPFYVPNTGPISDECCSPIQPCLVAHRCLQVVGRPNVQLQENRLKNRDQETSSERATEGVADWGPRQHHGHGAVGLASPVWTVDSHAHHPNKTGRASKAARRRMPDTKSSPLNKQNQPSMTEIGAHKNRIFG